MCDRLDWVGWRLARGEDGRGWPTPVNFNVGALHENSKNCMKYLFYLSERRAPEPLTDTWPQAARMGTAKRKIQEP